ncbi:hypothetical protein ABTO78_20685, partial [Acinetobacter baumannii]
GLPFLDHMLLQLQRHGRFHLEVEAKGDLQVDVHHLVEDVGNTLGQALRVRYRLLEALEKAARRGRPLDLLVVGGGPTGVELAGALAEF